MFCTVAMFCRSGPWGLKPEDPCFTNTHICPGGSPHQGCRHSLGVCKEAQVLQGNTCILKREIFHTRHAQRFLPDAPVESLLDKSLRLSGLEDNQTQAMLLGDLKPFGMFCILVILPPLVF